MSLPAPYRNEAFNKIYNMLFCDDPGLYNNDTQVYPWDIINANPPDASRLMGLTNDATLESRVRLLAYSKLKQMGNANRMKELLGVIVEVRLDDGLDTLAAYKDGTARYLNQYEKMVVWDAPSPESGTIINGLFSAAENVVRKIGPWDGERRSAPEPGMCRLTFLVSGDLYFGEGPFSLFKNDPMAGPVIAEATKLLVFLTEKAG